MQDVVVPDADAPRRADAILLLDQLGGRRRTAPGMAVTYTNNWPHEPLIGNAPTSANVLWSIVSVVLLLAGVGALVWWHGVPRRRTSREWRRRRRDPFAAVTITPSMRAVAKYLGVVVALFVVQVLLGALTAHYTVEGQAFFGIPLGAVPARTA